MARAFFMIHRGGFYMIRSSMETGDLMVYMRNLVGLGGLGWVFSVYPPQRILCLFSFLFDTSAASPLDRELTYAPLWLFVVFIALPSGSNVGA